MNKITKPNFPEKKVFHGKLIEQLRYGENPHQMSGIYSKKKNIGIKQIHGKQLSYKNYNDIFSALAISKTLPKNIGTVIVKHANPCGVSFKKNPINSYKFALARYHASAFGCIFFCIFKFTKHVQFELNKFIF